MKRLSLKARLTLLYTGLMILLFVIISALLFSLGSQAILTDTRSLLEERVSSSFDLVEYRHDRLEFDSDLLQVEDGVYLSVYDTEGELLYGRLPYHFTYDLPFEQDALRRIDTDDFSYYVLDMSFRPMAALTCACAASSPSRMRSAISASSCGWPSSCFRSSSFSAPSSDI